MSSHPRLPSPATTDELWIGFDSEYVERTDPKTHKAYNEVLSYQTFCIQPLSGKSASQMLYTRDFGGKRLSLGTVVANAVSDCLGSGVLSAWPKWIVIAGHFTVADITALKDFHRLKSRFDAIHRTFTSLTSGRKFCVYDRSRNGHNVNIRLIDTLCLTPTDSKTLDALGESIGLPKLDAGGWITQMDLLLEQYPDYFAKYGLRDAEIPVKFALRMRSLCFDLGLSSLKPTLGGISVGLLKKVWEQANLDRLRILGLEVVRERPWNARTNRLETINREPLTAERNDYERLCAECYHGGRNETFFFGFGRPGVWSDYDLAGAYPTALALVGLPDWASYRRTKDVNEFKPQDLGFARVRFTFPSNTRCPCLPVRTEYGLVFPLSGVSNCCSPEISLACQLGARLEILDGVVVPSDGSVRPFLAFVKECTERRNAAEPDSLESSFYKTLANSAYGKIAQAIERKRVFDSRSGDFRNTHPSPITCAPIAAWMTSFVRAVLGEILTGLPPGAAVASCTTDGFLTDANGEDIASATQGPLCCIFSQGRMAAAGNAEMLKKKHELLQPLSWRTRGQATFAMLPDADPDADVLLAKAGIKPPHGCKDPNAWINDLFLNRNYDSTWKYTSLTPLSEIWRSGGDLMQRIVTRRLNMEYDFKRRPVDPEDRPIGSITHIAFDTTPWDTADDFGRYREAFDKWGTRARRCLKNCEDLRDFEGYQAAHANGTLPSLDAKAMVGRAKKLILGAYERRHWGFQGTGDSRGELAKRLTEAGVKTSRTDFENAVRSTVAFAERSIPKIPEVADMVERVKHVLGPFDDSLLYDGSAGDAVHHEAKKMARAVIIEALTSSACQVVESWACKLN